MGKYLCDLAEIPDPGAKQFKIGDEKKIIIVRKGNRAYGYLNKCPHRGIELNWQEDDFLDIEKKCLRCSMHGAKFEMETGNCVSGPPKGQCLETVPVTVRDGKIMVG